MAVSMPSSPGSRLHERVLSELDVRAPEALPIPALPQPGTLASRLATAELAWGSVLAVSRVAGIRALPDPGRIAAAYRSDRLLRIDDLRPDVWSALSGFWRTADGWVRTHGNYPHHAERLARALGESASMSADGVAAALRGLSTDEALAAFDSTGALGVAVRPEDTAEDARLRSTPLIELADLGTPLGSAVPLTRDRPPLAGIRVLDLTRVIAGPVCTRTLALLGADVLRIDPPFLPEPAWQHLDTGHAKRSAVLDARSPAFAALLAEADVIVLGYRPSSMARLGLSVEALAERRPGLVIAELSAWGADHPTRAGFDSLVQAESGIAWIESPDGERPGALPAQALDHSAGYLLAAAVTAMVLRGRRDGVTRHVRTSLRRVAAELLGMPRGAAPTVVDDIDTSAHAVSFSVDGHVVTTARPALPGLEFSAPRRWGGDPARWRPHGTPEPSGTGAE